MAFQEVLREKSNPKAGSVCVGLRLVAEPHRADEALVGGVPEIRWCADKLGRNWRRCGTGGEVARLHGCELQGDFGSVQEAEVGDRPVLSLMVVWMG
jgi:hypothetical protein